MNQLLLVAFCDSFESVCVCLVGTHSFQTLSSFTAHRSMARHILFTPMQESVADMLIHLPPASATSTCHHGEISSRLALDCAAPALLTANFEVSAVNVAVAAAAASPSSFALSSPSAPARSRHYTTSSVPTRPRRCITFAACRNSVPRHKISRRCSAAMLWPWSQSKGLRNMCEA